MVRSGQFFSIERQIVESYNRSAEIMRCYLTAVHLLCTVIIIILSYTLSYQYSSLAISGVTVQFKSIFTILSILSSIFCLSIYVVSVGVILADISERKNKSRALEIELYRIAKNRRDFLEEDDINYAELIEREWKILGDLDINRLLRNKSISGITPDTIAIISNFALVILLIGFPSYLR